MKNAVYLEERWRKNKIYLKYGLSFDDFINMYQSQGGKCKICGKDTKKMLAVDHKHIRGFDKLPPSEKKKYVRGMLCQSCNYRLGLIHDDANFMQAGAKYIKSRGG